MVSGWVSGELRVYIVSIYQHPVAPDTHWPMVARQKSEGLDALMTDSTIWHEELMCVEDPRGDGGGGGGGVGCGRM